MRNFGLIWPIGRTAGAMHQLALRSRSIWLEILDGFRIGPPALFTSPIGMTRRQWRRVRGLARAWATIARG